MRRTLDRSERIGLGLLLFGVSVAFATILAPFLGAVLWGVIIALLFDAPHRALLRRMPRFPSMAALLTVATVIVIVILPMALLAAALAQESALVYHQLQSDGWRPSLYFAGLFDLLPTSLQSMLERYGLSSIEVLQARLADALKQGSQWIAARVLAIGQNTFAFIVSLFVSLYLTFFLLRDGRVLSQRILAVVPLAPAHKQALIGEFSTVIRATVSGSLVVALVQGMLGGLAFWYLEVGSALLGSVVMAVASLLPAVGAALVWLPVAIYLLLTGSIANGVALIAYGVLVIGLVDNLLRPILVGQQTRLPDYVVLISTLGGIAVLGINGVVIGPAIAVLFIVSWRLFGEQRRD